jgi:hypothetical protein
VEKNSTVQYDKNYFVVTGPGKLTVGKLYGGILIYEIWKTTRFSNLEILAKMEQEMASKLEKVYQDLASKLS